MSLTRVNVSQTTSVVGYATDANSNFTAFTSSNGKIGQLNTITYNADGTVGSYTEDNVVYTVAYANGMVSNVTGGNTVTTITYDALNRVLSVTTP